MINPGTYKATVKSHAISETKAGAPQATITFDVAVGTGHQSITWFGSFKEGALKHTISSLIVCGLKGNNPAGALEIGKEVSLVIEDEVGQDNKTRSKVRWINALGVTRNVIPQDMAKAKLSALEGAVMAARQESGTTDDDEIPF